MEKSAHSLQSSYREALLEHLFIGELLRRAWLKGPLPIEVMKPQVDNAGYDLVVSCCGRLRHIQLKSSFTGSRTASQKVHLRLGEKQGGCVVWLYFEPETLELGPFLFFGNPRGSRITSLKSFKVARHTKGDASGYKAERPMHRVIPKGKFRKFTSFPELCVALFGREME